MKKKWMSGTLALLLAGTTVASMMPAVPVQAAGTDGTGTTYYVDSKGVSLHGAGGSGEKRRGGLCADLQVQRSDGAGRI